MSNAPSPSFNGLLVACLCAQWCGTCKEYAPLFEALQAEFAGAIFRWIDIEDESELVDPIEVENFPTLLIATEGQARFFGTLTPHIDTLKRLIQSHASNTGPSRLGGQAQALVQRINALPQA